MEAARGGAGLSGPSRFSADERATAPPVVDNALRQAARLRADEVLKPFYDLAVEQALPAGTEWFDAHAHIGQNDPDGVKATAAEVVASMDRAGHRRSLAFPFHEPDGYRDANDAVIADAAASGGRLVPLCRVDPHADPVPEAERALAAGARGVKLHPRAEAFTMDHPEVERIVALAHERRAPVLIHGGRGIPALGEHTVALARRFPGARLIIAHVGISDLAWIWEPARELPNLFFDTSWWAVSDIATLFALVPPGNILFASDTPYGSGLHAGLTLLRVGLQVGLGPEALAGMVGAQLERVVGGEEPLDLGPPPGSDRLRRHLHAERVSAYLHQTIGRGFAGADPSEPLSLARLSCDVPPSSGDHAILRVIDGFLAEAEDLLAQYPGEPRAALMPAIAASLLAGTPDVPVPDHQESR